MRTETLANQCSSLENWQPGHARLWHIKVLGARTGTLSVATKQAEARRSPLVIEEIFNERSIVALLERRLDVLSFS